MNAQFQVAQLSGSSTSVSNAAPPRIFRLSKPLGDQAVVVNLGYEQKTKVDFSSIANEKITLVHIGDKLIILFDNKSTVTVEPFFDSRHDALGNLTVEVAPGREVSVNEFASLFPITTDQSVLPAAGEGGNAQGSGANFSDSSVDPLATGNPLDLLGQEELGNFRLTFETAVDTVNDVPQALTNDAIAFDEDGLTGGLLGGVDDFNPGSNGPISATGILAHSYGSDGAGTTLLLPGTPPPGFIYTLSADQTVLTVSQFQNGVPVDVIRISLSNTTDGAYTVEQLHAIDHAPGNNENDQAFTFSYEVRDSDGDTAQGSLSLAVDDDSPVVAANAPIVFDEDALPFGNLGGIGDLNPATNGPITATGTLAHSYGADGAGTTLLTAAGAPEGFTYAVNGTGTVLTVSQLQDGVNVSVLQVVLTDRITGNYTVTQLHAINHAPGQDENNQAFTFNYNVTDHDGDTTGGTLALTVNDDTPIALSGTRGEGNQEGSGSFTFATVYEDGLTNLNSGNQSVGNAEGGFQTTSVVITASNLLGLVSFGADQPGTFSLNPGATAPTLFSHGAPVSYSVVNGTLTASAGGHIVFTLHDNGDQTFTFVLKDQLDHGPLNSGGGDFETLTINLASAFLATDSDGDSVVLNGAFNIRVENDVPVQNYSATVSGTVQEDALTDANSNQHSVGNPEGIGQTTVAEGELSALVKVGADETGTFSLVSAPGGLPSLTSKGAAVLYSVSGDTLTGYVEAGGGGGYQAASDRAVFTLQITSGGHYKFTLLDQLDHLPNSPANNDSQTLSLNFGSAIQFTDSDGDSITLSGGLNITVEDDLPLLTSASISRTVDEDDIQTAWSQGTSPSDGSGDGSLTEGSTGAAIVTGTLAGLVAVGADEPGTFAFSPDAIAKLTALGLFSKETAQGNGENGKPLFYQTSSGGPNEIVITGYEPNPHGNPVLSLTLNTVTGAYEFRLFDELIHVGDNGENTDLRSGLPVDGVQASVPYLDLGSIITFTDKDGDTVNLSGKFTVTITDDVPHADIDLKGGSVTVDETPGNQADDTTSNSVKALFAKLEASGIVGDDPDVTTDNNGGTAGNGAIAYAHSDFAVVVDHSVIGSDSPPYPHQFSLSVTNGSDPASGLFATDGSPINLSVNGDGLIIGTVVGGAFNGKVAFAIAIDSDGEVSVAQYLSIKHDDRGDSNETNDNGNNNSDASPNDPQTIQQTLDGKITATLTVTDSDGDQSSNSVNIGKLITFLDDGPSIDVKVVHEAHLVHDETPGIDAPDDDVAGTTAFAGSTLAAVFAAVDTPRGDDPHVTDNPIGYALATSPVFSFNTQNYGADGPATVKPIEYELVLSSSNVHSGLQTTDGRDIHLFKEGNLIVGRYEVGGNNSPDGSSDEVAAFAISIDPATGQLAMVQYVSLYHPDDGNPDDTVTLNDDTLSVQVTITDGDGDPASDTVDISSVIQFEDDGPTITSATLSIAVDEDGLATGNTDAGRDGETLGTGSTVASAGAGALNALVNFGADGPDSAAFSLAVQSSPVDTLLNSKGGDVFIVSDGTTLRGYVNLGGNSGYQAGTDREVFTLTVGSNGSYTFTLKDQIDHPSLNGSSGENLLSSSIDLSKYIVATDGDGDSVKLGTGDFVVQIRDDIPIQVSGSVSGTVEEDDLTNANSGNHSVGNNEDNSIGKTVATGSLTSLVKVGADENGTFTLDSTGIAALQSQNLTSHNTALTYSISGDTLTAKAGSITVFTLQIQSSGSYTFTLKDQLDHAPGNGENTLNINLSSVVRFTDFDSDGVTLSGGFSITVQDDIPVAKSGTVNLGTVYEDGLTAANSLGQSVGNLEAGHSAVTATITAAQLATLVSVGADEPLTFGLNGLVGNPSGLTSHGDPVTYSVVGNTLTASAGGTTVFTIVDNGNQTFTFTLKDQIDHSPNTPANDDGQTLILNLASAFKATDYDGDSVVLGGSLNITIEDDVPTTASNTLVTVDEDDLAAGNHDVAPGDDVTSVSPVTGTLQFSVGADEPATVGFASLNGTAVLNAGGSAVKAAGVALFYLWDSSTHTLYATPDGTPAHAAFKIQVTNTATGAYSFSLLGQVDHPGHDADGLNNGPDTAYEDNININLTYTVTDRDGDSTTGTLTVSIDDDMPVLVQPPSNLITNGDFSQGNFTSASFGGIASAPGSVTGWVFSNSTVEPPGTLQVERVNDGYLGLHTSTLGSMIDMGASPGNIQIAQQLSGLTAGQTYAIQFEAGAPFPSTAKLEIIWNNVVIGTIDPAGPMTSYSYVVTATGVAANDQITFREVGLGHNVIPNLADEGYHGTYLANVAVVSTALVDEDGLTGPLSFGNHDSQIGDAVDLNGDADNNEATATGNLNIKWGADNVDTADATGVLGAFIQDAPGGAGNRSLTFTDANVSVAGGVPLMSHGFAVSFVLSAGNTVLSGMADGRTVFQVSLSDDGTGKFRFVLLDQLDHAPNGNENDITLTFNYTAKDSDGDAVSSKFVVSVDDDVPVASADTDSVSSSAQTLNFDDVPLGDGAETPVVSPYHGFNFIQTGIHNPPGSGPFATYAPHSGSNLAFVGEKNGVEQPGYAGTAGDPITIAHTDGSRFTALGAWFSSNGSEPMTITVSGYVNGTLVDSFSQVIHQGGAGGPTYVNLSILGSVDKITLDAPNYFGFDDFSYTDNSTAAGNVITGAGTTNNGADLLGADGAKITGVVGVIADTTSDGSHNFQVAGQYGTLVINENGGYTYTRFDGTPIVANDVFTYTLTDGDGDFSTATLTIGISDHGVTFSGINAQDGDITVYENDLLANRGFGESAGSSPDSGNLTKNGTFAISATDGLGSLVIDGHAIITNGVFTATSFTTATGNAFAVTAFDGTTVSYSYTLVDNEQHASVQGNNNLPENLSVVATDIDGESVASTIKINIVDDVPTAQAGAAMTVAETDGVTSGTNLLLNDTQGADGATVTAVDIGSGFQAIAVNGTTTLSNANGTYTFQADGTWTFDPSLNASNSNTTGNFTYQITDGDGDTSTATQAVNITNANTIPTAGSQSITVDEDGLPNGIAATQPGDVDGNAITQTGTLIHNFNTDGPSAPASSDPINFSPMDNGTHTTLVGFSSGGVALKYYWDPAGDTLYASKDTTSLVNAQSTAAFKVVLDTATGAYTYTQIKPVDHPGHDADGANNGPETSHEDNLSVNLTYLVKDSNGDSATGTLAVTINDDAPAAAPIVKTVTEGSSDTNILLILDRSGSMAFDPGVSGFATRLDLLKAAANELLDQYDAAGDVRVQIIRFNDNAQKQGSVWLSVADAKTYINGLSASDGTDYDDAAALAPDAFDDPGKLTTPGVRNVSYFISDGQPEPTDEQVSGSELTNWINFVNANDIVSYAIGLGSSAPDTYLDPLAYDGRGTGSGTDTDALIVTNLNQLQSTLVGTVNPSISGSVIDGNIPTSFGADGGYVKSIAIDGKTYTYSPASDNISTSGSGQNAHTFDAATNKLTITFTGSAGESFVIDLDDGTYVYTPPTNIVADFSHPFTYTLTDNDGDTATSTLTIIVDNVNGAPVLDATDSPFLVAVNEDAVGPVGAVGTLVSSLVDLPTGGGFDNVTDADGPGLGIAITATNSANGTWFYSTNNGVSWIAVGAVSSASALLLEADGSTRLYFQPAANFSGTVTDGITFRAWDESTGTAGAKVDTSTNGGISAFSSAIDTAGIIVNAVNDAPVITAPNGGAPASISVAENTTAVTNVDATDVDAGATLTYSISGGLDAAKFSINSSTGALSFVSAPNFEAPTDNGGNNVYDVIVQVSDGTATDTQAIAVTVTNANDVPVGVADHVYTNASSSGNGTTIVLQNAWLVKNDTDPEGDTLNVATASDGNDVDNVNEGASTTSIRVDVSQGDTGNFFYTATDGSLSSGSTTVTVHRGNSDSTITGGSGNDILLGTGSTAATLDGGAGSDFVTGGSGADTLVADQNDYLLNGGGGTDTLRVNASFTSTNDAQIVNIENVTLTAAATLNLSNQTEDFTITGSAGIDSIIAGSGDDTIAGAVNDTLLAGGGGADSLQVGANFTSTGDGQITGIETVQLTAAATLNLANQSESFKIIGSSGVDTITGGSGNDTINAGAGNDTLTGNGGADQFRLSTNGGTDIIADYVDGTDKIGFFDSGSSGSGSVNFASTAGSAAGTSLNGSDFLTVSNISNISNSHDDKVIRIDNGQTTSVIQTTTIDGSGSPDDNYVIVFNTTTSRGEIWYDTDWSSTADRTKVATLDNITTLAQLANITASDVVVYNSAVDPIVLDLDHNGVAFSSLENGVSFDINHDGAQDQVAWTANGGDGILALDVDGSGKIESGNELFTPNFNGGHFADGIAALASLDGNHDGVINSQDQAFGDLVIWQDANHNGVSETGELARLGDLGISSISLTTTSGGAPIDGQNIAGTGSFIYADGTTGTFVEVDLDASLGTATAQPDSHPAEAHDLSAFAAVAAEIDHGGGNIDLSALQQPGADHAPAPQGQGAEAPHPAVDAGATTPAAITIMHEQAALAMQLAAS